MDNDYEVKDISLAKQGHLNIEFAEMHMAIMQKIRKRFEKEKPFEGLTIALALHVTKETAVLVKTLIAGGAKVALASCNPLSTQDDVAAALAEQGVHVYAYKGENKEDYYKYIEKVISHNPDITIDDGCDLVTAIHTKHQHMIPKIIGGCEETTTGIIRLKAMERDNVLKCPMIAVNDNKTKHLLDNYYGTGQSSIDGLLRASNILIAGKIFVVCGYGDCGKGVAMRASGMGANVIVTEVDAFRAMKAVLDGYRVMPMAEAVKIGEIFLTVTGDKHVIRLEHMKAMKNGTILANSGHFDNEIDVAGLENAAKKRKIRPFLDEYEIDGKKIFVAAEGRLVNLGAAEGHPSEVMATSFAGQAFACEYLVKHKGKLGSKVITLPEEIDNHIAELQLEVMGVKKDELTEEQKKYLGSWEEGT
ncbi:adenosylhomocysteinase [Candidatus Micrarchaeota archaeon]|nr:adenosylhomocysteinase [Candidatus Micrarchaeota archaeon]MBU1165913.1 adenosylhomocysteinase [Candidatus Micrarchaeota archaeon]MBU1886788.1 adenosylhomocysteinase [Candidatus Micrarchaeota archaeon]